MATRKKKKKKNTGLVILLVLLILILTALLTAFIIAIVRNGLPEQIEDVFPMAERNDKDRSAFVSENGRVTYPGAALGIDVSEHQQEIDWTAVKNDGVEFAIIRMGFRGSSQGGLFVDERFYQNLNGAIDAGLDVGVYFYSQANCVDEAVEEAEYVLAAISGYTLQCPVFYDWEEGTPRSERLNGVSFADVSDFSAAFCKTVADAGYQAGVYFNQKLGYSMKLYELEDYCFWLAEYNDAMTFAFDAEYWQYTYQGTVDGISTQVDLNLRYSPEE